MDEHHTAHLIDADGVTETPFERTSPTRWTNTEEITLRPGSVLDLGGGMAIRYPSDLPQFIAAELEVDLD